MCDLRAGESCLHDLKRVPIALYDKPYHSLVFYLPRAALEAIADDANAPRIRDLSYKPGAGVNDGTISCLGNLLLPALRHPDQANRLFVDHALLAVGVHVAQTYGGMRPMSPPARGGLAPWQQRRVVEFIEQNLAEDTSLDGLAKLVRLSPYHFLRSFKRSLGEPPHRYWTARRIERAKTLLANPGASITEVAFQVGFSGTSAFSAAFRRITGQTATDYRLSLE